MTFQLRENQARGLRRRFHEFLQSQREGIVNSLLTHIEGESEATDK